MIPVTITALVLFFICPQKYVFADDCAALQARAEELAKCCTVKDPFPRDAYMQCYNSVRGTDEEKLICAVECNFRQYGILDQNNELSEDKVLEYVDLIEEDEWRGRVEEIVKYCWEKLEFMKQVSANNPKKCPLLSMIMQMCLANNIFVMCPAQEWHSSNFCDDAKQSKCLNRFNN